MNILKWTTEENATREINMQYFEMYGKFIWILGFGRNWNIILNILNRFNF